MNISESRPVGSPIQPPGIPAPEKKEATRAEARVDDIFAESPQALNEKGKLPVIFTSVPEDSMKKLKKLLARKYHCENISDLPLINGMSCDVDPGLLRKIAKILPPETGISIDNKIEFPTPGAPIQTLQAYKGPKDDETGNVYADSLGLDRIWEKGYTGKGVGVAVIDSGIFSHEDFGKRIIGWKDMTTRGKDTNYDPFGHGTHVSGILAGSGKASGGKIKGVAPEANLVGVRITSVSEAIKGLQWVIENKDKFGIKVINMSLGDYAIKGYKDDPWAQAAEKAVDAGLTVVVAAGNEGPPARTISTPGTDPKVITVGSLDDKKTVATDDDGLADNSSKGPTPVDNLDKPDLVAFGVSIYAPLSPGSKLDIPEIPHYKGKYISFSGTSMATPEVAGLCALLLSANPNLTNEQIKQILMETAVPVAGLDKHSQGKGRINPEAAIQKAEALAKSGGNASTPPATTLAESQEWLIPGKQ